MSSTKASTLESAKWGDLAPGSLPTRIAKRQRLRMFGRFLQTLSPAPDMDILDVGVTDDRLHDHSNYFEAWYPHKSHITASGLEERRFSRNAIPGSASSRPTPESCRSPTTATTSFIPAP